MMTTYVTKYSRYRALDVIHYILPTTSLNKKLFLPSEVVKNRNHSSFHVYRSN